MACDLMDDKLDDLISIAIGIATLLIITVVIAALMLTASSRQISLIEVLQLAFVIMAGMAVIFLTREMSHDAMCLELCNGDKDKAKKLHDGYHEDGFL
jgi:hypothetical protein